MIRTPSAEDARAGVLAQYGLLATAVAALPDAAFARPTRLGDWTVAELVAHLASTVDAVPRALARPEPERTEADLLSYLGAMRDVAPAVAQRAADNARDATPGDLRARLAAAVADTEAALRDADPRRLVLVRLGAVALGDFLATRCVEGVVHGLDLRAATGVPETPDAGALKVVVRAFAALLESTAPGRSVEVRIPGHVAVQCVTGPRHTRGTPPNVVETDAVTFVELAAGRLAWAEAMATGAVRASGERADLGAYLPLIG
ncbi:MAG: hypothetical protein QOE45_46 [Frankiaceae bacterium]|jgi:uncharacterized protein (TIGR03083 family)|nr:hypothetical protein [Frankiaceae bacterium]